MRIRTQNLIAIVPLFVGMAVAAGALTYWMERKEMIWGLDEEATSLAVAMAEFVDGDALREATAAGTPTARFDSLRISFDRVIAHGQAKHIFALTPVGTRLWSITDGTPRIDVDLAANASFVPPDSLLTLSADEMDELSLRATPVVRELVRLPTDESIVTAFAPVTSADGELTGIMGVVIDAARLEELGGALLVSLARLTLLALAIGALTSLLISSLLTHRVRSLSRAALEVAGGDYDRQIHIGTIQEISDLSNTFNTMSSVLKDLIERARRALLDGEQYRTPLDLARTYREEVWTDLSGAYGDLEVVSRSIGGGHPGDLFGVIEQAGTVTVYIGRVNEEQELEAAIAAAAARRAIEGGIPGAPVSEVLAEVSRLLEVRLETISWKVGSETEAELVVYSALGEDERSSLPLGAGRTALLHTFPNRTGEALQRWKTVFDEMAPAELLDNLARTLDPETMGTLLAVGSSYATIGGRGSDDHSDEWEGGHGV